MSATVRDNILFSHEYDEGFYNLVLDGAATSSSLFWETLTYRLACALRQDLALLAQGDMTEVGEKG